jgi:uncharacterized protein (TIGR02444 family)
MLETFWDFSIRTYRTDDVPGACISLQEERGVDVNMLLYCCWFGMTRGEQRASFIQDVFEFSENWAKNVVRPLRQVRTWMKSDGCPDPRMVNEVCSGLRDKIKGNELAAEKIQQDVLESLTLTIPEQSLALSDQLDAIIKNIRQYFDLVNIKLDDFTRDRLLIIIKAGMAEIPVNEIQTALMAKD